MTRLAAHVDELAALFPAREALTQAALLDAFGVEGLRRRQRLIGFLVAADGLSWSEALSVAHSEQRRIAGLRERARAIGVGEVLDDFLEKLPRKLTWRTHRSYATAAVALLASLRGRDPASLDDTRVAQFLREHPGQRNAARSFLRHLRERYGAPAAPMRIAPQLSQRTRDRRTLRRTAALCAALRAGPDPAAGRAYVAALIAVLFALPLETVLALPADAFRSGSDGLRIATPQGDFAVTSDVAEWCLAYVSSEPGARAFPGRTPSRPFSAAAVKHHVDKLQGSERLRRGEVTAQSDRSAQANASQPT